MSDKEQPPVQNAAVEETAAAWKVVENWRREADDNARQWQECEAKLSSASQSLEELRGLLGEACPVLDGARHPDICDLVKRIEAALRKGG